MMSDSDWKTSLEKAIDFRFEKNYIADNHDNAFRLFNGYTEKFPKLVIDIYAKTAVINDLSESCNIQGGILNDLVTYLCFRLPFLKTIVLKQRYASSADERNGQIVYGIKPDTKIVENGIVYALDLFLNRDSSFYLDTRLFRKWLFENTKGMNVLNTFSYTGSLGVAAFAGDAQNVIQTDLSDRFLSVAQKSYSMNHIYYTKKNFIIGDFFEVVSKLKRQGKLFECVILDPPFFSKTKHGIVDLEHNPAALLNKVRPLVADNGIIALVNNSLYLSGRDYLNAIDSLCDDKYLIRQDIIPVPDDFTGWDSANFHGFVADPYPFNYPTKIVILKVHRKVVSEKF